jgi:SAM-dependent methyltransferase
MAPRLANWYDYPQYFDLAFRDETPAEVAFLEAAFRRYVTGGPVRRLFEPGCGSGRLVAALAARGYQVTGLDLSAPALAYLRRRLVRRRLEATLIQGDMAEFRLAEPVDAAFCTFNTFRHLTTEAAARRHLECMAAALRPGGIYVLGLHLLPLDVDLESCERWTARHGRVKLTATLRVLAASRRKRLEQLRLSMLVRTGTKVVRLRSEFALRMYTAKQFRKLLASVPAFTLGDVFDFWYEIDRPRRLDDEMTDTVVILQRK